MKIRTTLFTALILSLSGRAEWKIATENDPITDDRQALAYTKGTTVDGSTFDYQPILGVMLTQAKSGKMTVDAMISIQTDGLRRRSTQVTYRLDSSDAVTVNAETSSDRRTAYIPNPVKFASDMKAHTNLTVRYTTTLGAVRTTRFNLAGLSDALKSARSEIRP